MRENFRKIFSLLAQINVILEGNNHNDIGLHPYLRMRGCGQVAHHIYFSAFKTFKDVCLVLDIFKVSCSQVLLLFWSQRHNSTQLFIPPQGLERSRRSMGIFSFLKHLNEKCMNIEIVSFIHIILKSLV